MTPERYDVIVVGQGAMGAAATLQLARRGARVLGLEQFDIPHSRGSSHGHSRMIRLCYYEHPDYVPLLMRAYELWRELETISQQTLLIFTGGLYMGPESGECLRGASESALRHGLPHEILGRADLARRYPMFNLPRDHVALYEPNAGFLRPEAVISACVEHACRAGAVVHAHEPLLSWEADDAGATVRTPRAVYRADHLVFAAGAWSGKIVRDLGVELTATRQVLGWVWPRRPELFALGRLPCWAIDQPDGALFYGFPMMAEGPGLKIARHIAGEPADPDAIDREVHADDERDFRPLLERFFPDGDGSTLAVRVCMYTNTPDSHFIIDRHPRHGAVSIACGFSGHGFKFASVVGEALADLATRGRTALPIGFLGLSRFMGQMTAGGP